MTVIIRKSTISDLESILSLNKSLFEFERQFGSTYNLEWTYSEQGRSYFAKRIEGENGIVLVAESNNEIVGYAAGFLDTYAFRSVNPIVEVENMFIKDEYRGKDVGRLLLSEMSIVAKSKGVKRLRVGATAQNIDAIRFYQSFGFSDFELYLEKDIDQ